MTIRKQLSRYSYTPEYDRDLDEAIAIDTVFGLCDTPIDKLILHAKLLEETESEACRHLGITLSCYRQRWHRLGRKLKSILEGETNGKETNTEVA